MVNIEKIRDLIEKYKPEIEENFSRLVTIPSVKNIDSSPYPFGENINNCLEEALKIGRELGFYTKNVDGYAGVLSLFKEEINKGYMGIFGHLDVVSAGSGWSYPPFKLTKMDKRYYGRGVLDNKGPLLSTIYAVKILKDLGVNFKNNIKIIMGTDEESGMSDMVYFLKKETAPIFGFTPDCKFPVVYGENGIIRLKIFFPREENKNISLEKIEGEFSRAYIPDKAILKVISDKNFNSIVGEGKRAPSNNPYLGENAIISAMNNIPNSILENIDYKNGIKKILRYFSDVYGEALEINYQKSESERVLLSFYDLKVEENFLVASISIRYPVDCSGEEIIEKIKDKLKEKIEIEAHMAKVLHNPNSKIVKDLSKGYFEVTKLDSTPVTTTGGTYARKVPNIVAFGPSFPGEKGIAHNKDEYMDIDSFFKLIEIYALSIYYINK